MSGLQKYTDKFYDCLSDVKSILSKRNKKTKKKSFSTSTAIEINEKGFAIAEVSYESNQPKILNCQFVHNTNQAIRAELISEIMNRKSISSHNFNLLLTGNSYKFLMADAPDAPVENLRFIMPSKIKDSLPWKITEISADVLQLPKDAFRGRKNSVYVAVAPKKMIEEQVELLKSIKIDLEGITTTEIAMKAYWNVVQPEPSISIGIMRITETGGVIVMMCDGAVYLARRIIVDLSTLNDEGTNKQEVFDQVVLEIQRSIDFYESQLGKGAVSRIVLLPPPVDLGVGFSYIEQNISTDIVELNPLDLLGYENEMPQRDQAYCIGAIGAAIEGLKNV